MPKTPATANKKFVSRYSTVKSPRSCVQNSIDFAARQEQKQVALNPSVSNFYAGWRARCRDADALHDENGFPAERLLQAVWRHQRLRRDGLKTGDGQAVRVLHPGFASAEGGPDFRGAVVQIGGEPPRSGDVEVDLRVGGWHAHGHDRNPAFQNVILHVVWETGTPAAGPARDDRPLAVPLKNSLDAPLGELSLWLENESAPVLPESLRGRCSAPLRALDEGELADSAGPGRPRPFHGQGRAIYRAGAARRLGTGLVGGSVPRPRLQAQRLADAKPRGNPRTLGR